MTNYINPNYNIPQSKLFSIVKRIYEGEHPGSVLGELYIGTMDFLEMLATDIPNRDKVRSFTENEIRRALNNFTKEDFLAVLDGTEFKTPYPSGVWFVYGLDTQAYPIGVYDDELEAYKTALANHGFVMFWEFGKIWDEMRSKDEQEVT